LHSRGLRTKDIATIVPGKSLSAVRSAVCFRRTRLAKRGRCAFSQPAVAIETSPAGTPQTEDDCMRQIPLGTKGTFTLRVLPEHLANRFKDAMLPQVLATPVMILIMENAALSAIRPFLDSGESAVGTAINVRHLAATPVGHDVRADAEVVKVEGKRIEFKVSASDDMEEIGSGTHQRVVIDLRSFNERLDKKSKR
jgi:fluoroacetyl-CoA thioesterase